jgi:hypothetical protein
MGGGVGGMGWGDGIRACGCGVCLFGSSGIRCLRRRPKTGKMHMARYGIFMTLISLAEGLSGCHERGVMDEVVTRLS